MKNVFRLFVLTFVLAISTQMYAQRVGLFLGLNMSNLSAKNNTSNISKDGNYKMNAGLHLGVTVDIPLYKFLSLETGLMATTKGFKSETDLPLNITVKAKDYLFYVDLPIMVKGTLDLNAVKLYAELGPYLGLGVYGILVTYTTTPIGQDTTSHTIKWGSGSSNDLRRFDMGLTFGGGVEVGPVPIFLGFSYDLGLINMAATTDNGNKITSGVFKISLGYRFGKNSESKSKNHKRSRRR